MGDLPYHPWISGESTVDVVAFTWRTESGQVDTRDSKNGSQSQAVFSSGVRAFDDTCEQEEVVSSTPSECAWCIRARFLRC